MKRILLVLLLFTSLAAGCRRPQPTHAGGKPVSHWLDAVKSTDPQARRHALEKLGNIGTMDAAVLPAVRSALADPDGGVRKEAIDALMRIGSSAKECVPDLEKVAKSDTNPKVRERAARAVEYIRGGK